MEIIKTLAPQPEALSNCYVVTLSYEHGDADLDEEQRIYAKSDEDLIKLVETIERVAAVIDQRRGGYKYPENFIRDTVGQFGVVSVPGTKLSFNLEYDKFSHEDDYYASFGIYKVEWYDNCGDLYNVELVK